MEYDDIMLEAEDKMEKTTAGLEVNLKSVRGGRATTGLVENLRVEYYGSQTPLKNMANISAPEPRLLVIRPFDASVLKEVEKAILTSDLGMTPQSDGKLIRLSVPPLSEERRLKLASRIREMGEESKISLRNIRRDSIKSAEKGEKDGDFSLSPCPEGHSADHSLPRDPGQDGSVRKRGALHEADEGGGKRLHAGPLRGEGPRLFQFTFFPREEDQPGGLRRRSGEDH